MKKLVLAFIMLVVLLPFASAQIGKGSVVGGINGNLDFERSNSGSYRSFWMNSDIYGLYFIRNNFGLGLEGGFDYAKAKYKDFPVGFSYPVFSLTMDVGPVARKYFGKSKLMPYVQLGTGASIRSSRFFSNGIEGKTYTDVDFYIKPAVGMTFWLNERVGIDTMLENNILENHRRKLNAKIGISFRLGK